MDTLEELANALRQKAWDEFLFEIPDYFEVSEFVMRDTETARALFNAAYDFFNRSE